MVSYSQENHYASIPFSIYLIAIGLFVHNTCVKQFVIVEVVAVMQTVVMHINQSLTFLCLCVLQWFHGTDCSQHGKNWLLSIYATLDDLNQLC